MTITWQPTTVQCGAQQFLVCPLETTNRGLVNYVVHVTLSVKITFFGNLGCFRLARAVWESTVLRYTRSAVEQRVT